MSVPIPHSRLRPQGGSYTVVCCRIRGRKTQFDDRPTISCVPCFRTATMQSHDAGCNRQSQAHATAIRVACRSDSIEGLKDSFEIEFGNTRTVVANCDNRPAQGTLSRYLDCAAGRRKSDRVAEDIADGQAQKVEIPMGAQPRKDDRSSCLPVALASNWATSLTSSPRSMSSRAKAGPAQ